MKESTAWGWSTRKTFYFWTLVNIPVLFWVLVQPTAGCKNQPPVTPTQAVKDAEISLEMLDAVMKIVQQSERDRPGAVVEDVNKAWEPIWMAYNVAAELEKSTQIVVEDAGNGGVLAAAQAVRAATCGVGRLLAQHDKKLAPIGALLCF